MFQPEYFYFLCSEILNIEILPLQGIILKELWARRFPMLIMTRGGGKSFLLAVYSFIRALLLPERKILIAGASFRQSKVIFNYMERIWAKAPLLRDICNAYGRRPGPQHSPDMWFFNIGSSTVTAIPIGPGGEKIRGQRANDLLCDEFNSIPKEIFETVLVGFTAVSSDPLGNVKRKAAEALAKKLEIDESIYKMKTEETIVPNQIILSGTAGYSFESFHEYWQDWHDIISSRGDAKRLERYIGKKKQLPELSTDDILANLNYKDYSIIRIPFAMTPKGFMDEAQIMRSKATMHLGTYLNEYGACFSDDSQGFFRRSAINACTCGPSKHISHEGYGEINFSATLRGDPNLYYIMGIDPASENDNFAIVILELHKNHRRVVYTWTTNKKQQKYEIEKGFTKEQDYYAYCVLRIRALMRKFNTIRIMLDPEGGGRSIREGLINERLMGPGEQRIFEVIGDKPKDTDYLEGLHILEMAKFSSADWIAEANNGLKFDLERRILLFPYFDAAELALAEGNDLLNERIYDTLEYCMEEIEELKNELTTIALTRTPTGRDRWDTPEIKLPGGKKGRERKDRYSALLIANMGARQLMNDLTFTPSPTIGGFAGHAVDREGKLFYGDEEYNKLATEIYKLYG